MFLVLSACLARSLLLVPDLFKIAAEDIHIQRFQRARVVDVSERTCLCPNCGGTRSVCASH